MSGMALARLADSCIFLLSHKVIRPLCACPNGGRETVGSTGAPRASVPVIASLSHDGGLQVLVQLDPNATPHLNAKGSASVSSPGPIR
jgi:hypothetical protein